MDMQGHHWKGLREILQTTFWEVKVGGECRPSDGAGDLKRNRSAKRLVSFLKKLWSDLDRPGCRHDSARLFAEG
jgi:hypothetical protein